MSSKLLIIDVREPYEYQQGHVEGALNISPSELMAGTRQLDNIDKGTQLVVYCKTGSRSNVAIHLLQQMGFTNLINGINADHVTKKYIV